MSSETIRGTEVRDGEASTFDPSNLRFFSILPDCDADESYCVRHDREMPAARIVLKYDGALYTTADGWDIYSCPDCYREMGALAEPQFKQNLVWAFETFDDTDADVLDGAFRYVGEAGSVDVEPGVNIDE
jgi:hypothetical protein